jgi:hypothetical protein
LNRLPIFTELSPGTFTDAGLIAVQHGLSIRALEAMGGALLSRLVGTSRQIRNPR